MKVETTREQQVIEEYLAKLRRCLKSLPAAEQDDAVAEARSHIEEMMASRGCTEADILRSLGTPEQYASGLLPGAKPCPRCGRSVGSDSLVCPHCGETLVRVLVPTGLEGYEYRSKRTLFGLPLVHIATGIDPVTGKPRVAKGIVAIGNVAVGGIAIGGVAIGGVAFGGLGLGLVGIGGLAVGLAAFGGGAIGLLLAVGGGALGTVAIGGGAIGYYALGGGSMGVHAVGPLYMEHPDQQALAFFRHLLPWMKPLLDQMSKPFPNQ